MGRRRQSRQQTCPDEEIQKRASVAQSKIERSFADAKASLDTKRAGALSG